MDHDDGTVPSCPKCGAPRLGHAWDCAQCGHIFDASATESEAEQVSESPEPGDGHPPPATLQSSESRTSPSSASRQPPGTRPITARQPSSAARAAAHGGLRGWVDENLVLAIALAVACYLAVFAFLSTQLVASSDDPFTITGQYRAVVGESPPTAFKPALSFTLVGRRLLVFFNQKDGQTLLLYHEGWLAGRPDATRLAAVPDQALRFFELPYDDIGTRDGNMLRLPVRLRVVDVRLGSSDLRGFIATFTGTTDRPALLCLVGSPDSVTKMARKMFTVGR
jgi:hypothetical protein